MNPLGFSDGVEATGFVAATVNSKRRHTASRHR